MLARPKMYAPNPEALENLVHNLDTIRRFARGESIDDMIAGGYSRFLQSKGSDAPGFCSRRLSRQLTQEDLDLFADLAAFVTEYRHSEFYEGIPP